MPPCASRLQLQQIQLIINDCRENIENFFKNYVNYQSLLAYIGLSINKTSERFCYKSFKMTYQSCVCIWIQIWIC